MPVTDATGMPRRMESAHKAFTVVTAASAAMAVFLADLWLPVHSAIAALYIIVVAIVAGGGLQRLIVPAGLACLVLAALAYFISPVIAANPHAAPDIIISDLVIAAATALAFRMTLQHAPLLEQARDSQERYAAIFHESPVSIWESDWTRVLAHLRATGATPHALRASTDQIAVLRNLGSTRIANKATARLFGTEAPDAMVGKTFVSHYMPSTEAALAEIFATFLEGEQMREVETQFRTAQGRLIDVLWRATLLPGESEWSRVLITAIDVTDRNSARAKLEQASADLAHAARVSTLGQLSASIAHEVSQPLAAIKTYADSAKRWLAAPTPDMGEVKACLDGVIANTTRASETLARVRSLARKDTPEPEAFDLADLITESVRMLQREANAHATHIRELIEPGLPDAFANRVQIQQVIVNLLLNAIQAMDKVGGRQREVVVSLTMAQDQMMNIDVRDNGTGIALENPNAIFQPFHTTKTNGMGMGLAICRSIVEAHGGAIRADNNSAIGATVSFTVPSEVRAADARQRRSPAHDGRTTDDMAGATIAASDRHRHGRDSQGSAPPTKH